MSDSFEPSPDDLARIERWRDDDDYDFPDGPDYDEPLNRVHFDDLNPLIREAARDDWERRDYRNAIKNGWNALRDEIRRRLGVPGADGVDLINRIGETEPNLALTDYATETDRDMHRGLVNFLRGIAFYIRNPEMHETTSPVADDKDGALSRLIVMSLCADHVVTAALPTAIEDSVRELKQPRFQRKRRAYQDLLSRVPARRRSEFMRRLLDETVEAFKSGDQAVVALADAFRLAVLSEPTDAASAAVEVNKLVAADETLVAAALLATPEMFSELEERHQLKLADFLIDKTSDKPSDELDPHVFGALIRLFNSLPDSSRSEFLETTVRPFQTSSANRTMAYITLVRLAPHLNDEERRPFVAALAAILGGVGDDGWRTFLSKHLSDLPSAMQEEVDAAVADEIPF